MHQKRESATMKLPIPRKGTAYVARALNNHQNSVPVIIAVRDMLNLVKNKKNTKKLIHEDRLKINGRTVKDYRDSIQLFNIFEADKKYKLVLTENGRFDFVETKDNERLCKIIGKKIVNGGKTQLNLHDGTNVISDKDYQIGDSVYLSFDGKITKSLKMEKGKECLIIKGKYLGKTAKINSVEGQFVEVTFNDTKTKLNKRGVIVQ